MVTTFRARARGAAGGVLLDRLVGEPPSSVHPVAAFGSAMNRVERAMYADRRDRGIAHAVVGSAIGIAGGWLTRSTTAATTLAVGGRALARAARDIDRALASGDLPRARALLPTLVGRDPTDLDEKDICRAVVESVAENTVDAIVAPALWGAVFGAGGALGLRAVNTMDAMVGHRNDRYARYGWAAARLDDAAAWIPARATAAFVALVRPNAARAVWLTVRRDAPAHPSPNAGVAEAAFAAALGVRLGGENRYGAHVQLRPPLGDGRPAERQDIERAVRLSRDVSAALAGGLLLWGLSA